MRPEILNTGYSQTTLICETRQKRQDAPKATGVPASVLGGAMQRQRMSEASEAYFWRQYRVMSLSALARYHDESYTAIDHAIQRYERRAQQRTASEARKATRDAVVARAPEQFADRRAQEA